MGDISLWNGGRLCEESESMVCYFLAPIFCYVVSVFQKVRILVSNICSSCSFCCSLQYHHKEAGTVKTKLRHHIGCFSVTMLKLVDVVAVLNSI